MQSPQPPQAPQQLPRHRVLETGQDVVAGSTPGVTAVRQAELGAVTAAVVVVVVEVSGPLLRYGRRWWWWWWLR